jgi:NADPH2:quinone reductase
MCGEVVDLGEGVTGPEPGTRVITPAALPAGAFAEYAVVPAAGVLPAPDALDDAEAAALHIGYQTGWFALHRRAALRPGETLLVHAAAGGVGSAAVQLGKAAGATVIGVVGGPEKAEAARDLGADVVVDRYAEDFVAVVKEATSGRGANVVFDPVGGEAYTRSTKCIAFEGRIVVVGFTSGSIPAPGLNHALVKNYSILGLHWGLYNTHDPVAVGAAHEELTRLAASGAVRPLVSARVPMDGAAEAVQRVADGRTVGRVTVIPQGSPGAPAVRAGRCPGCPCCPGCRQPWAAGTQDGVHPVLAVRPGKVSRRPNVRRGRRRIVRRRPRPAVPARVRVRRSGRVLPQLAPGQGAFVHLVRAVGQPQGPGRRPDLGQREVLGDAARAVQLDRAVHDPLHRGRGGDLDRLDLGVGALVAHGVHQPGGLEYQ